MQNPQPRVERDDFDNIMFSYQMDTGIQINKEEDESEPCFSEKDPARRHTGA